MKIRKAIVLMIIAASVLVVSTVVFAEQTSVVSKQSTSFKEPQTNEKMDPIQKLERVKEMIRKQVEEGKITKQEGAEKTNRIDEKIKEIQSFNKLSASEKKDKLIKNFTQKLAERVKENKMTQPEADKALTEFKAMIDKWDGTGYPPFPGKDVMKMKGEGHHHKH